MHFVSEIIFSLAREFVLLVPQYSVTTITIAFLLTTIAFLLTISSLDGHRYAVYIQAGHLPFTEADPHWGHSLALFRVASDLQRLRVKT
jgi:hypothetical protein